MTTRQAYSSTRVGWGQTQGDIIALLAKYGITDIRFTNYAGKAVVEFLLPDKHWPVRLSMPVDISDRKEADRRYRVLFWYIKSKLEAANSEVTDMETEWLPYVVIGPSTVSERMLPVMDQLGPSTEVFGGLLPPGKDQ